MNGKEKTKADCTQATAIDWARLAAFIDGEGSISIGSQKPRKAGWSPRLSLQVCVTNTDIRLMGWLKQVFGGEVYPVKVKEGRKPTYRWYVLQDADVLLKQCVPYFIMKREQAEVAFAFKATFFSTRGKKVPPEVLSHRLVLKQKMHELNGNYGEIPEGQLTQ